MNKSENAAGKQDTKFKPGQSGNPAGKRPGTRHKSTMMALALMEKEVQGIVKAVIDAALAGDLSAAALVLNKLVPNSKDYPVDCRLPKIKSVSDLSKFTGVLLDSVASGRLGPSEGEKLSRIATVHREAILISDFEQRLSNLEFAASLKRK